MPCMFQVNICLMYVCGEKVVLVGDLRHGAQATDLGV